MTRLGAAVIWIAATAVGLAAWVYTPAGFALVHPRTWVGVVAPAALMIAGAFGVVCVARKREAFESRVAVGALIVSGGLAAVVLYERAGVFPALVVGPTGLAFLLASRDGVRRRPRRSAAIALLMSVIGAGTSWALRAPDPSTRPLGSLPEGGEPATKIETDCGRLRLRIDPTLTFEDGSRSRFWSPFNSDDARSALGPATVVSRRDGEALLIDAGRTLSETLYSHLNRFTLIEVWRAKELSVRLAPESPSIEVPPSAPMRFLTWDGENLRAYEASDAEKGPFRPLAEHPVRRGSPVSLELLDGGEPQCRVTLLDFTAQASTELSPTAGYGLPQNAIELLASDGAPVQWLVFSLAATSVGRGFDTVGHAAGDYRNRIVIE